MLKFPKVTEKDLKALAKIQHSRNVEEARKLRIFDPKFRFMGIDKHFLDQQIEEKKKLCEEEKKRERQMDESLIHSSQFAMILEQKEEEERKKINKELNSFRQNHQRPEDSSDFDLNDPDRLKKSLPPRIKDDDPRIGPSSAQIFEGEDLKGKERLKIQKEQMQAWLIQQMHEKRKNNKERQNIDECYEKLVMSRNKRADELKKMEQECRRKLNEATAQFNRTQAEELEYRRHCEIIKDEEDKRAEIYNHLTGDFLTEAKEQADSNRGPNKPLPDRYKGMTSDQLKAIWHEQALQLEEIRKMKLEEQKINERWEKLMQNRAQSAMKLQEQMEDEQMRTNKLIAEENLRLAEEQKQYQEYLKQAVYKSQTSPEFYSKFNTSAR